MASFQAVTTVERDALTNVSDGTHAFNTTKGRLERYDKEADSWQTIAYNTPIITSMTTAVRNALPFTPTGIINYNTTTSKHEYYDGSSWGDMTGVASPANYFRIRLQTTVTFINGTRTLSHGTASNFNGEFTYIPAEATIHRVTLYTDSAGTGGTTITVNIYAQTDGTKGAAIWTSAFTVASPTATFTGMPSGTAPLLVYTDTSGAVSTAGAGKMMTVDVVGDAGMLNRRGNVDVIYSLSENVSL